MTSFKCINGLIHCSEIGEKKRFVMFSISGFEFFAFELFHMSYFLYASNEKKKTTNICFTVKVGEIGPLKSIELTLLNCFLRVLCILRI